MGAFIDSLPADTANAAYAPAVLQKVQDGGYDPIRWARVTSSIPGHQATFAVMSDSLKIEGVRMSVSATLEQQIADTLGASLLTPRLADLIWQQRTATLLPTPRAITSMKNWMIWDSTQVQNQIGEQPQGLLCTVGKHWVISSMLDQHPSKACNYGWHFDKNFGGRWASCTTWPNTDCRVIQDPGTFHDRAHIDYSQTCVLVSRQCVVDGVNRDLVDILRDPVLAKLANNEGPLTFVRQPGVALESCKIPTTGVGDAPYGTDGKTACPIQITGLPSDASSVPPDDSTKTLLTAGGLVAAGTALAWGIRKMRQRHA